MPARSALTLFHFRGIRIGIDYSWFFILFLLIVSLSSSFQDTVPDSGDGLAYVLAVISALAFFGSILLHELGHAIVSMRKGIPISDITLWMFGGIARMTRDSDSPGTEFQIAIAGPAVTAAIVVLCGALGVLFGGASDFWDAVRFSDVRTSGELAVFAYLASINLFVLVFNLLPAFPLDGGRIARAIAWKVTGNRNKATRFAAIVGQGFSYVFMGAGILIAISGAFFSGLLLVVIGFILGSAARGAIVQTELSSRIEHITVADVMDAEPVAITEDTSIERALDEYFLRYRWPWFPVVDAAHRFRGLLERGAADAVPEISRASARVGEVFSADAGGTLRVRSDAPIESLLGNDALRRLGALAAVDSDDRLLGVITAEQVGRALRDALAGSGE